MRSMASRRTRWPSSSPADTCRSSSPITCCPCDCGAPRWRLEFVESGDPAGLPVVFLHGVTDSWRLFEDVMACLPSSIRAIAVSQRGHGDSSRPNGGYRIDDLSADLFGFMDALRVAGGRAGRALDGELRGSAVRRGPPGAHARARVDGIGADHAHEPGRARDGGGARGDDRPHRSGFRPGVPGQYTAHGPSTRRCFTRSWPKV